MNYCMMIGRLTKAPEQKQTPNGIAVTTFTIAVNRRSNREQTDFFNVVTWRGLAENCAKYLQKGQQAAVTGELQTRNYEDKNGVKHYVTEVNASEVEFLAKASGAAQTSAHPVAKASETTGADFFANAAGVEMIDDDSPF